MRELKNNVEQASRLLKKHRQDACSTLIKTVAIIAIFAICTVRSFGFTQSEIAESIIERTNIKGGLIVHLGCGDGSLTAELLANDSYLVHGLDSHRDNVALARERIQSQRKYGKIVIEHWDSAYLPYIDNIVNLIVVEEAGRISEQEMMRVLVPGGVVCIRRDKLWHEKRKPVPGNIDEWTHYLHGPDNNAVAHDQVSGPPVHLQWIASPNWTVSHEHTPAVSAVVSANGRLFSVVDEGPLYSVLLPDKWNLVARDAFNGVLLWRKPLQPWRQRQGGPLRGIADLARRLVAVGDTVYVPLEADGPVCALDAATGKKLKEYSASQNTLEMVVTDDVLLTFISKVKKGSLSPQSGNPEIVAAFDLETGKELWRQMATEKNAFFRMSLTASSQLAVFQDKEYIHCVDLRTGKPKWKTSSIKTRKSVSTIVIYKDVVLNAMSKQLTAYSAVDGRELWSCSAAGGYAWTPIEIFVIQDLVWVHELVSISKRHKRPEVRKGRNLYTGKIEKEVDCSGAYYNNAMVHPRCHRNHATDRYIVVSPGGIGHIDLTGGKSVQNPWVRGACQFGNIPCNGLLYLPPSPCMCYLRGMIHGFYAMAPRRNSTTSYEHIERLRKGKAYDTKENPVVSPADSASSWPTYRGNELRSGSTKTSVSMDFKIKWKIDIASSLTPPVAAGNRVYIASKDNHTLYCIHAETGKQLWNYAANGMINSPPTIYRGRVYFGCTDGYVYSLTDGTGELVWSFRAAPEDKRLIAWEHLESVWPVPGSVLIKNDTLYCVAGRSSYIDNGIYLYRLNPKTGAQLSVNHMSTLDAELGRPKGEDYILRIKSVAGYMPDILSADENHIYMRNTQFTLDGKDTSEQGLHLFTPLGFLDTAHFRRAYWLYSGNFISGWEGWGLMGNSLPAGRIMVYDDECIFSFGRKYYPNRGIKQWSEGEVYHLFATSRSTKKEAVWLENSKDILKNQVTGKKAKEKKKGDKSAIHNVECIWSSEIDLEVRAMVLTEKTLFVAGVPAESKHSLPAYEGKNGIFLRGISARDGKQLKEIKLDSVPIFDGLISSNHKLFIANQDGTLICLE